MATYRLSFFTMGSSEGPSLMDLTDYRGKNLLCDHDEEKRPYHYICGKSSSPLNLHMHPKESLICLLKE